jgi:hypothetical protein
MGNAKNPCVLAVAIKYWSTKTTKILVESIENIFSRCYEVSYFPLAHAAAEGDNEIVEFLVHKGADVNKVGGVWGTALQAAAYHRAAQLILFLLNNGAGVNAKGGRFGNALQAAVARDNEQIVRLLQYNGARLDPPGAEWDALLVSIEEASGWDRDDTKIYTEGLDRFQWKYGMKARTEAQSESESKTESEAQSQFDSSSE